MQTNVSYPWIASEGGPIETIALSTLIVAAAAFIAGSSWSRIAQFWHVPFGLFLLAEREAAQGLPWVESDVLRSSHWRTHDLDLDLAGNVLLVVATIWALGSLVRHGLPAILDGLRRRSRWLTLLLAAGCVAVVAQLFEEAANTHSFYLLAEEGLELIFAICLLTAVMLSFRRHDPASGVRSRTARAGD